MAAVVVARSCGPSGRGTIVTLTVWGQILGWLAAFSMDKALVVLTSGENAVASPDEGLSALRVPLLFTSGIALAASVALGGRLFTSGWLVASLCVLAVATAQGELIAGWLLAMGHRSRFILWRLAQPAIYLALTIAVALAFQSALLSTRIIVMGAGATASMVIPVALGFQWLRSRQGSPRGRSALLKFASIAHVGVVLQYLNGRLDVLALSFMVTPAALGYYSAGAALGQIALITASAGVIRGITRRATGVDLVGLAVAGALAVIVIVVAPVVVPAVFGDQFRPAVPVARILALGAVMNYALQASCGQLVGMRRPALVAISQGVGVAVFAVGILMFPNVYGVAWSSVGSFAVSLLITQMMLRMIAHKSVGGRDLELIGEPKQRA
ncbi:MAG: lipopolysaccharide biosynthesis protein [Candidatus Dormibacteria bacterium]